MEATDCGPTSRGVVNHLGRGVRLPGGLVGDHLAGHVVGGGANGQALAVVKVGDHFLRSKVESGTASQDCDEGRAWSKYSAIHNICLEPILFSDDVLDEAETVMLQGSDSKVLVI